MDELYRKTYIPLKAKAKAEKDFGISDTANDVIVTEEKTPYKPEIDTGGAKVDNNASRRDITE